MYEATLTALSEAPIDLFCAVAAVADYAIKNPSTHKQKKSNECKLCSSILAFEKIVFMQMTKKYQNKFE